MIYPTLVMCFAFLVLTGMLLFLVPIFVKLFDQLGGELPFLTQCVMTASEIMRDYCYIVFPLIFAALSSSSSASSGRSSDDAGGTASAFASRSGIGKVVLKVGMARFSRTLSSLVGAGVDIIQALEITGSTSGQQPHRGRDQRGARAGAARCDDRAAAHRGGDLPTDGRHMMRVGEETGELEKMLTQGRRLLRGRGRRRHPVADLDHRAAAHDLRRLHRRGHRHRDVPADVQDPHADPMIARRL